MNASPAPPGHRLRAPKGGAVSPVNGRFYRGGCFMPRVPVALVEAQAKRRFVRKAAAAAGLEPGELLGAGWIGAATGREAGGAMIRAARADRLTAGPRRNPLERSWGFPVEAMAAPAASFDPADLDAMLFAVGRLGDRERAVVRARFGLDGSGGATQAETGRRLGMSRHQVGAAEAAALGKLRDALGAGMGVARA